MDRPQQPEIARSGRTPVDPDDTTDVAARMEGERDTHNVPPENQPGHRPEHDQDKPTPP